MIKRLAYVLIALSASTAAFGQTVYVTDILRLGIHEAQDTSDAPFANLMSGTKLEILDRVPNFARVRTPDGREGWVKSAFLVEEKPAQLIVAETLNELSVVKDALAAAQSERDQAVLDAERVIAESTARMESTESAETELERLRSENAEYTERLDKFRHSLPIPWVAGVVVLAGVSGFLLGLWSLDAYIRRKHSGFRLY